MCYGGHQSVKKREEVGTYVTDGQGEYGVVMEDCQGFDYYGCVSE